MTAGEVILLLRAAYNAPAIGERAEDCRRYRALAVGCQLVPHLNEDQVMDIVMGRVLVREHKGLLQIHRVQCPRCERAGCSSCENTGFELRIWE